MLMMRWRKFLIRSIKMLLVLVAVVFATSVYAQGVEPRWFKIERIEVEIANLDPAFDGYTIAQLTDLHARSGVMNRSQLERVAKLTNRQQPDAIVLTGDYISKEAGKAEEMLGNAFQQLKAKDGVIAVMGNHDRGEDSSPLERAFAKGRIRLLNNDVYSIDRQGHKLNIAGVDDVWMGKSDLTKTVGKLPERGTNIILAHEPDFADKVAATNRFALQLSGHTHGGQIVLPFAPRVTPPWGKKYVDGLYRVRGLQVYVSPGVGTTGPPKARFNCRPEISSIVLRRA
jgi:uncharacterized protein